MKEQYKLIEEKMEKSVASLKAEFDKVRAGRANPAVLDGIKVDYYGTATPIPQLATVSVPEAHSIMIQPWDASVLKEIEKAIKRADELGLATMVCADSIEEVKAIAKLGPNILVAEPTELIGTGKPADKEYVDEVIRVIKEINPQIKPFPSAGVSKPQDCYNIVKAGAAASGCSSAIAKSEQPLILAEEMIKAVRQAYDERNK